MWEKIKNSKIKFVNTFSYFIRSRKENWDEREKRVTFSLICLVLTFLSISVAIVVFFDYLGVEEQKPYLIADPTFVGSVSVFILIGFVLFFLTKKFQIFLWIVNCGTMVGLSCVHYYSNRKGAIFGGSPIATTSIVVGFSWVFGNTFNVIFWTSAVFLNYIAGLIIDCRFNDVFTYFEEVKANQESGNYFRLISIIIFVYSPHFIVLFLFLVIVYFLKEKIRTTDQMMDSIEDSVLTLNFETKQINALKDKKVENCSKNEKILKGIVNNMIELMHFLPDNFLKRQENSSYSYEEDTYPDNSKSLENDNDSSTSESPNSMPKINLKPKSIDSGLKKRNIFVGLKRKDVVCMMIDAKIFQNCAESEFDNNLKTLDLNKLQKSIVEFCDIVVGIIYNFKGSVQNIKFGSRIVVTFNAERIVVDAASKACECAVQIEETFKRLKKAGEFRNIYPVMSIIKIKQLANGIIKTNHHMKYHLIDRKIMILDKILDQTELISSESNIFVDKLIKTEMKFSFIGKQINVQTYKDSFHNNQKVDVFRIERIQKSKISGGSVSDEWFYKVDVSTETEEDSHINSIKLFNQAWQFYKEGNKEKGLETLHNYLKDSEEDVDSKYLLTKLQEI